MSKADGGYGGGGGQHAKRASSKRQDLKAQQERHLEEVWANNLEDAITRIRDLVETYQHVAMDSLLPGIVAQPTGPFVDYEEYNYQTLRCNVDLTRALQLSMTLSDGQGVRPKGISTWRFNFAIDPGKDLLGQEQNEATKTDIGRHQSQGIDALQFGELLMSSGLVLNDEVKWIFFTGNCDFADRPPEERLYGRAGAEQACVTFNGMYNFAYFLQLLTSQALPEERIGFQESLDLFFPCRCDVAAYLQQLPPGPPLSSRDPSDPLRRPLFCSAQHVMEAFFRLPEGVRRTAFDGVEERVVAKPVVTETKSRSSNNRRRRNHTNESNNLLKNGLRSGSAGDAVLEAARAANSSVPTAPGMVKA